MKRLNDFLCKVGTDKALHFAFGGWIVSAVSPFGIDIMGIALFIVIVLSFIKELFLDEYADFADIVSAFFGGFVAFVIYIPVDILLN